MQDLRHFKPFLLLQARPEDDVVESELGAIVRLGGLLRRDIIQSRIEQSSLQNIYPLDQYSGIFLGGSPSNVSDTPYKKSDVQKRYEKELKALMDEVVEKDIPYLGLCYGIGILAQQQGVVVSKKRYSEEVGASLISLTKEGKEDALTQDMPEQFEAYVGHKEACQNLPEGAVWLASSEACPYQMFRVKNNVYATQFHPELDLQGIVTRLNAYQHHGYFEPEELESLYEKAAKANVEHASVILSNFVKKYSKL